MTERPRGGGADSARGQHEQQEVTPDLLWVLAGKWNRRVLRYFWESDVNEVAVDELATRLANQIQEGPLSDRPDDVELHLNHAALPKLAEHDLVEYDREAEHVRRCPGEDLPDDLMDDVIALDDDD